MSMSKNYTPADLKRNFINLYFDIGWYGILSGSTLTFLVVYATRLGASSNQVGLVNASPAVINLIFALPAGIWLLQRDIHRPVFWLSVAARFFYLLLVPLPLLMAPAKQIWAIIILTLIMNVPQTGLSVGFQSLFGAAVPDEYRARVSGIRNAVFSVTTIIASLACGFVLENLSFETGYQIVFLMGFVGAMLSSVALWFVRPLNTGTEALETLEQQPKPAGGRFHVDILRGKFGLMLLLLFGFHLAQYIAIPVFPLFTVNVLGLSDQVISLGSSLFYVTVFIGSTQLEKYTARYGNKNVVGFGVVLLSIYPVLLAMSKGAVLYLITSLVGGAAWSLVGGAIYNYLLERIPAGSRPSYLSWYNLVLNAAILIGSLGGPAISNGMGIIPALLLFGLLRFLAGLAILRWG